MSGTSVIIPAAGRGERFGSGANKVFAEAAGKPLLAYSLLAFETCEMIDSIILVVGACEIEQAREIAVKNNINKLMAVVAGGDQRQDSVERGLVALDPSIDLVAVHDGARPLVNRSTIETAIIAAKETGAAVAAVPVIDTIKSADSHNYVVNTLDRSVLWSIQTPQVFSRDLLIKAYKKAREDGVTATDDSSLVERLGHPVKLIMGSYDNIKVTTPLDLKIVRASLSNMQETTFRIGFGYDIHRFEEGRKLFLGGVEFPGEAGLKGHSDADVILHAIADAMLGAASLGDIGKHFPDSDIRLKGISSIELLRMTNQMINDAGWTVVNIDVTLVAERPKIADHTAEMQQKISEVLGTGQSQISIKATTAEKLGEIGKGTGAACYAVAALSHRR